MHLKHNLDKHYLDSRSEHLRRISGFGFLTFFCRDITILTSNSISSSVIITMPYIVEGELVVDAFEDSKFQSCHQTSASFSQQSIITEIFKIYSMEY